MNDHIEKKPGCIATTLSVFGDKWTALIVRDLCSGAKRFSQLEKSLSGISPRTLSQRLDMLESENIITKKVFSEPTLRTEYSLTQKGEDCEDILKQMASWGEKYSTQSTEK